MAVLKAETTETHKKEFDTKLTRYNLKEGTRITTTNVILLASEAFIINPKHTMQLLEFSKNRGKINLIEQNEDLKLALKTIYEQAQDGPLDKKWVGWKKIKEFL